MAPSERDGKPQRRSRSFERKALTISIALGAPDPPISISALQRIPGSTPVSGPAAAGASRQNNLGEKSLRTRDGFGPSRTGISTREGRAPRSCPTLLLIYSPPSPPQSRPDPRALS